MNPFIEMAQKMTQQDSGLSVVEGVVLTTSPLSISAFGLTIPATSLMVNPHLQTSPVTSVSTTTDTVMGIDVVTEVSTTHRPALATGDKVLCLALGATKIYIIAKVVQAT